MASKNQIIVSDNEYDTFLQEVTKLPEKKRKQFKSSITDKYGQKTKVIWKDGKLLNYSLLAKAYAEVIPQRVILQVIKESNDVKWNTKEGLLCGMGFACDQVITKSIEENHTGNHEGRVNHTIKVMPPNHW